MIQGTLGASYIGSNFIAAQRPKDTVELRPPPPLSLFLLTVIQYKTVQLKIAGAMTILERESFVRQQFPEPFSDSDRNFC